MARMRESVALPNMRLPELRTRPRGSRSTPGQRNRRGSFARRSAAFSASITTNQLAASLADSR
eukprot:4528036-Lingulodinium_polyedra.AAC.1